MGPMNNTDLQMLVMGQVQKSDDEISLEKLAQLVSNGVLRPCYALEAAYKLGKKTVKTTDATVLGITLPVP